MTTQDFLVLCSLIALGILVAAFLVIAVRIIIGPTLPDRVLALDMLVATGIGFIAVVAVKTGYLLFLDIAIALGLVGFLATVAFARFILKRDRPPEADADMIDIEHEAHPPRDKDSKPEPTVRPRVSGRPS
ncbi:cation:proton antiporter [Ahrensia marina]|uniref:cation:proton antiporter n=1 Tax=Ahrensia marina TaxID=1514904 RepID=UPI0035D00C90